MIEDIVKDLILQNLGPLKKSPKGWMRRDCMMCHTRGESADRRKRFGVLFTPEGNIALNCFNCGFDAKFVVGSTFSKKFESFLREIGVTQHDIKKINFELFKVQNKVEASPEIKIRGIVTRSWKPMALPDGALPITEWIDNECSDVEFAKVVEYAAARKFTDFENLYWTPGKAGTFNKRLILPFYYKNKIVGYTGRYYGDPPSKEVPKYLNYMPSDYIYNLDAQYDFDRKYVILNEGIFDAYFIDGISTCGNTLNAEQIQIINSLGKTVIVCPDKDKNGTPLVNVALKEGWHVCFPKWGDDTKDAAKAVEKYGRLLTLHSIIESDEQNPVAIELKWKMSKHYKE